MIGPFGKVDLEREVMAIQRVLNLSRAIRMSILCFHVPSGLSVSCDRKFLLFFRHLEMADICTNVFGRADSQ
jgi:hypothetical protein